MLRSRRSPTRQRPHGYQPSHAPQIRTSRTGGNLTRSPAGRAAPRKKAEVPRSRKKKRVYPESSAFIFPADRQVRGAAREGARDQRCPRNRAEPRQLLRAARSSVRAVRSVRTAVPAPARAAGSAGDSDGSAQ